ncbi:MAG: hypothetical protein JWP27_816 [Flaviaesturariibacter sp.]|nr:hypothetical protein [Flaviaesturariibacter sp.]
MIRQGTILLASLLLVMAAAAQPALTGLVRDTAHHAVAGASITVRTPGGDIIAYCYSEPDGSFELPTFSVVPGLALHVSHINYEARTYRWSELPAGKFTVTLVAKNISLPSVIVRSADRGIRQSKDTIAYRADSFLGRNDRVLKDLLEKLPGITVSPNGQILYQNRAINKFYIEGSDIVDDRYNIVTNNLPVDAIDKVQVLENHQPIRILDSLVPSERAAINIQLKKDRRTKLIARGVASTGGPPFSLYNGQLSAFSFGGKMKFISALKANNTGAPLSDEVAELNKSFDADALLGNSTRQDFLGFVSVQPPALRKERYLRNADILQTDHFQVQMKKDRQLKLFTAFLRTRSTLTQQTRSVFYLPADTLSLDERLDNTRTGDTYLAGLSYVQNTRAGYARDQLSVAVVNEAGNGIASTGRDITQSLTMPFRNVNNSLSMIRAAGKKLVNLYAYTSYTDERQALSVDSGLYKKIVNDDMPYAGIRQSFSLKSVFHNMAAGTFFPAGAFRLSTRVGLMAEHQEVRTDISKVDGSASVKLGYPFVNRSDWTRVSPYAEGGLLFQRPKYNFQTLTSINAYLATYDTMGAPSPVRFRKPLVQQSASIQYKLGRRYSASAGFSLVNSVSPVIDRRNGYFLENYRTLVRTGNTPLQENGSSSYTVSMAFKDVLRSLFANATVTYSRVRTNLLFNSIFDGLSQYRVAEVRANRRGIVLANANLSKYILSLKTSLSASASMRVEDYQTLQQGAARTFRATSATLSAKAITDIRSRVFLAYTGEATQTANRARKESGANPAQFFGLSQQVKVDVSLANATLGFSIDHLYNNSPRKHSAAFADVQAVYKVRGRRIDITASVLNVFNNRVFVSNYFSDNNFVSTQFVLRPFCVTGGVRFNL